MRLTTIVICCVSLSVAGCKSQEQKKREADLRIPTPLEHDPTDQFELAQWWSNGKQLLRLDEAASYALFDHVNRYGPPLERGRWDQQSYAVLWLEPYTERKTEARRVSITRIDGKLALIVPKLDPFFALPKPPMTMEDRLIGRWNGALGALALEPDMRYTLEPAQGERPASGGYMAQVSNRHGRWSVVNNRIVLQPDSPSASPMEITIGGDEKRVTLNAPGGALSKTERAAPG